MKKLLILFSGITSMAYAQDNYVKDFNGTNASVNLGSSVGDGARSICFWFSPAATITSAISDVESLVVRDNTSNNNEITYFFSGPTFTPGNEGKLMFSYRVNSTTSYSVASSSNTWIANEWHHTCATVGSGGIKLYVDGGLEATTTGYTSAFANTSDITALGKWGNLNMRYFDGRMEEISIWNRELSGDEVSDRMCRPLEIANETGLVAYYKCNENTGSTLTDEMNAFDGTVSNTTWELDSTCVDDANFVHDFDGSNQYVDLGDDVLDGARSICFWFMPNTTITSALNNGASLVARDGGGTNIEEATFFFPGTSFSAPDRGRLAFVYRENLSTTHTVTSVANSWPANEWHHTCVTIDNTDGMRLYVDGVLEDTDAGYTDPIASTSDITALGRWGAENMRYYDGRLEELSIWDRALSEEEIQAKMCSPLIVAIETGLIAYYKMNEGWGTVLEDELNDFDGTVHSSTWILDTTCVDTANHVHEFNGTNAYVDLGGDVSDGARSICYWFKPNVTVTSSIAASECMIGRDNASPNHYEEYVYGFSGPEYLSANKGKLTFKYAPNSFTLYEVYSSANTWAASDWHHTCATIGASGLKLYVDGVLEDTDAGFTSGIATLTDITALGRFGSYNGFHYDGRLEEISIWNVALTATEVSDLMCMPVNAFSATGLVAYYKCNEGTGTLLTDETNTHDGTVHNSFWVEDETCVDLVRSTPIAFTSASQNMTGSLVLYPNPVQNTFNLGIPVSGNYTLLVTDIAGKVVMRKDVLVTDGIPVVTDASQLGAGTYIVQVYNQNNAFVGKIVK